MDIEEKIQELEQRNKEAALGGGPEKDRSAACQRENDRQRTD
jgi:hypothetical protein